MPRVGTFCCLQAPTGGASGTPEAGSELIGRIMSEFNRMQRFLPQSLIFVAAHALFIAGAIAVAALN